MADSMKDIRALTDENKGLEDQLQPARQLLEQEQKAIASRGPGDIAALLAVTEHGYGKRSELVSVPSNQQLQAATYGRFPDYWKN